MKTPHELADSRLDWPDEHRKRAASLRRLAGGLNAEARRAEDSGLSKQELLKLTAASEVLSKLGKAYSDAGVLAQQRRDDKERLRKLIRTSMGENFCRLKTIPERVALIAAVRSFVLRSWSPDMSTQDLDSHFQEAIDSLVAILADLAKTRSVPEVVLEAWDKFTQNQHELEAKHVKVIGMLVVDEAKRQENDR